MRGLEQFRNEIDKLDSELVQLLEKRFQLCEEIGRYKKENNLPIFHVERENEVLEKNMNKITDKSQTEYIKEVLITVMDLSKDIQTQIIKEGEEA